MIMTGKGTHYFASGNTAQGFIRMHDSSLQGMHDLYRLDGHQRARKSEIIQEIGNHWMMMGHDVHYMHRALDARQLEGIVAPRLRAAVVDDNIFTEGGDEHGSANPSDRRNIYHFPLDTCHVEPTDQEFAAVRRMGEQLHRYLDDAYAGFAIALRIHDEWETIYMAHMDYAAADRLAAEYIGILYGDRVNEDRMNKDRQNARQALEMHRFLGAATAEGAVDYIPNLTDGLKRYFLKGRPGSGKSTLLKKIAKEGIARGFDVEIYHCGFDPNSLDMVIVRNLGFAIFDSTAPHEYFPVSSSDDIVDMYARCIEAGTDEAYADRLEDIKGRYGAQMNASIRLLAQANAIDEQLNQQMMRFGDPDRYVHLKNETIQQILNLSNGINA